MASSIGAAQSSLPVQLQNPALRGQAQAQVGGRVLPRPLSHLSPRPLQFSPNPASLTAALSNIGFNPPRGQTLQTLLNNFFGSSSSANSLKQTNFIRTQLTNFQGTQRENLLTSLLPSPSSPANRDLPRTLSSFLDAEPPLGLIQALAQSPLLQALGNFDLAAFSQHLFEPARASLALEAGGQNSLPPLPQPLSNFLQSDPKTHTFQQQLKRRFGGQKSPEDAEARRLPYESLKRSQREQNKSSPTQNSGVPGLLSRLFDLARTILASNRE